MDLIRKESRINRREGTPQGVWELIDVEDIRTFRGHV